MQQLNKILPTLIVLVLAITMGFSEGVPFIANAAGTNPYYSIAFSKNNLTVYQGQTFTDVLSVYAVSPLQTIALSYSGSSPSSGITASLSPSYSTPDFNSTVTVFVPGNTPPGSYSLRFIGNNGYYKTSTLLNITVLKSTFYVTLNPNSGVVHAGSSTTFQATAYSNIAPQTVTWSYSTSQGVSVSLSSQTSGIGQPITVTATVSSNAVFSESVPIVIFANSNDSFSANATYTLTPQFYLTMNSNPSSDGSTSPSSWYNAGSVVTITATPNTGYKFTGWSGSGSQSYSGYNNPATVVMDSNIEETATFSIENVLITFTSSGLNPSAQGTVLTVNGQSLSYSQLPYSLLVPYGTSVSYSWSSPISGGSNAQFVLSSVSGLESSQSGSFTATTNGSIIAAYIEKASITFSANGLNSNTQNTVLIVNGQSYSYSQLPVTITEQVGTSVSYSWSSPISGGTGTQFVWVSTSGLSSSQSGSVTIPSSGGDVIASYEEQYYLTMSANPTNGGSVNPSSGWFNSGTSVQISATANSGYQFVSWSGSGSSSYTGTNNPETITMNSPVTEVANFAVGITFSANGLNGNAQNTVLTVNGASYSYSQLPVTIYVTPGSTVNFAWSSPVSGGTGTQFVWTSTSGLSSSQSGTITASSPGSVTASYEEQFYLTMNANPSSGGSVQPSSGWYNAGTSVQISATPNNVYTFLNWSGLGSSSYSGTSNPTTITMNSPVTEIANFGTTISFPTLTAYDAINTYNGYNYQFAVAGQAVYQDPTPLANQPLTIEVVVTSARTGGIYTETYNVETNSQGWFYTGVQTIGGGLNVWGSGASNKELFIYYNGVLVKSYSGWGWGTYIPDVEAQGGVLSISVPAWDGMRLYSGITSQAVLLPTGVTVNLNTAPSSGNYFMQYAFYDGGNGHYFLTSTINQNPYLFTPPSPGGFNGLTSITKLVSTSAQAEMTIAVSIPFDTMTSFTVTLNGPNGYTTSWSGHLANLPYVHDGEASHTFVGLPPGTYTWSISPTSVSNIYNSQEVYYATPSSGTINDNSSETVDIEYGGHLYNVTFSESGLPGGVLWWVDMNGMNVSSTSQTIEFTGIPSGTFSYTIGPEYYYVSSNTRYYGGATGSVSVSGNTQISASWIEQFEVTTTFTPSYAFSTGVEPVPNSGGIAETWVDSGASLTVIGAPGDYWVVVPPFGTSPSMTPTSYGYTNTGGVYYYTSTYKITQPESITVAFKP